MRPMTAGKLNAELVQQTQDYGSDPLAVRRTNHYKAEYVKSFVEKWDELIDLTELADSEGGIFFDMLWARGQQLVLDFAGGTGFHTVCLLEARMEVRRGGK